ncbi:hypothetical protein EDE08_114107 [Bradyrhizobium sp. R2.2-H]|nr:hypothetical protein EDE08_114107 [Bradyrhizobium sp. R2.2-H]
MINGEGGWSKIDAEERKKFLAQICDLANECSRIFAIAFSLRGFNAAVDGSYGHPFAKSYRRRIELMTENERWKGERDYFESLGARLPTHERVGRNPGGLCIDFYKAAQSKYWTL